MSMRTWLVVWTLAGCVISPAAGSVEPAAGFDLEIRSFRIETPIEAATTQTLSLIHI